MQRCPLLLCPSPGRHVRAARRLFPRLPGHLVGALLAGALTLASPSAPATPEEAAFLRKVAEQYMLAQFANLPDQVKITAQAGRLDENRAYGGKCPGYLTAQLQNGISRSGGTVKLVCAHPEHPFTLYLPVAVKILRKTWVAADNLPRGTLLTPDLLQESWQPETGTAGGDPDLLCNSRLKREIKAGDQILPSAVCMVCKGAAVTIVAAKGNLALKTNGEALNDGNYDEAVQVRNVKSKKVVSGRVCGPDCVRVLLP